MTLNHVGEGEGEEGEEEKVSPSFLCFEQVSPSSSSSRFGLSKRKAEEMLLWE